MISRLVPSSTQSPIRIARLVLIGTGLIGGSFSLALKQAGAVKEVIGIGRRKETLEAASQIGVIDGIGDYDADTFSSATLIVVATPVGQMRKVFSDMAPLLPPSCVVTDGGSTKQDVVALARELLASRLDCFVPAHPVAGTEKNGPEAAFAELYRNRRVILTPVQETAPAAVALVRQAWQVCGARVSEMDPEAHDQVLAAVSHLPHLLSFALVDELAGRSNGEQIFSLAGGGFRDFTRIAASNPEMWRDIFISNRQAVSKELMRYREKLGELQHLLDRGDGEGLEALFRRSQSAKQRWPWKE